MSTGINFLVQDRRPTTSANTFDQVKSLNVLQVATLLNDAGFSGGGAGSAGPPGPPGIGGTGPFQFNSISTTSIEPIIGSNSAAGSNYSTIVGGLCNKAYGRYSLVGGFRNQIGGGIDYVGYKFAGGMIIGGSCNTATGIGSVIISGRCNLLQFNSINQNDSVIVCGRVNKVYSSNSFIGNARSCQIKNSSGTAILSGSNIVVEESSPNSVILGGSNLGLINSQNSLIGVAYYSYISAVTGPGPESTITNSVILSGSENDITNTQTAGSIGNCLILSGQKNTISNTLTTGNAASVMYNVVASGNYNTINNHGYSFIGSGTYNEIYTTGGFQVNENAAIVTGVNNKIISDPSSGYYTNSMIGCGQCNTIQTQLSFIGSGRSNSINRVGGNATGIGKACVVGGGRYNVINGGTYNGILVGSCNVISRSRSSSVLGGLRNQINDDSSYSSICGGRANNCDGRFSFIGGGSNNTAGSNLSNYISTDGSFTFIGGGSYNVVTTENSSIVGGCQNTIISNVTGATGVKSFIGGGLGNKVVSQYSSVVGGKYNLAKGAYTFVGGGMCNIAGGSGTGAFVGAGLRNTARGLSSSVVGGADNRATGDYSVVLGSRHSKAYGNYSIACGGTATTNSIAIGRGSNAHGSSDQGYDSIVMGRDAGQRGIGHNCIILGRKAMAGADASICPFNISIGNYSGFNIQGSGAINNVMIGTLAGSTITTSGGRNICIGSYSRPSSGGVSCDYQICMGHYSSVGGTGAIAIGHNATAANVNSIAIGRNSSAGSTGTIVIGEGSTVGGASSSGSIILGTDSGTSTMGPRNILVGYDVMPVANSPTCRYNTVIGNHAANVLAGGANNVFIGSYAGADVTSGRYNICIGGYCRAGATTDYQISVGYRATAQGQYAIAIGQAILGGTRTLATNTRAIAIGTFSQAEGIDSVAIGGATASNARSIAIGRQADATLDDGLFFPKNLAIVAGGLADVQFESSTGQLGPISSTIKYKKNVEDLEDLTQDVFENVNPRRFNWKQNDKEDIGFIAEEMLPYLPDLTPVDEEGNPFTFKYSRLSVILYQAIQKLRKENIDKDEIISNLLKENEEIKSQLKIILDHLNLTI